MEDRNAGSRAQAPAGGVVSDIWRVRVDPLRCIGSGICTSAAPRHFILVDDQSVPVAELVAAEGSLRDAAESCPVGAITVRDAGDDRLIAPET